MEPTRKEWPCSSCQSNLGFVVNGEFAASLTSIANVTTNGVNTVYVCKNCGRQKVWFAKESAVNDAFSKNQAEAIAQRLANLLGALSANR